ncbi:MAG: hypothetical protein U0Q16_12955 [Bryobacteraceae bacterium]
MGIHISYSGSLDDPARLEDALAMVREFCGKVEWECIDHSEQISGVVLIEEEDWEKPRSRKSKKEREEEEEEEDEPWPEDAGSLQIRISKKKPPPLIEDELRGLYVQVPDSETLILLFNRSGRLRYYHEVPAKIIRNAIAGATHYMGYQNNIKTGGVLPHVGVCAVLKMLKARFMKNLKVTDKTGFYKTGNMEALERDHMVMGLFTGMMKRSSLFLEKILEAAGVPKGAKITVLDNKISTPAKSKARRQTVH